MAEPSQPSRGLFEGRPEISSRRMTPLRRVAYAVGAPVIALVARTLWATCRLRHVDGEEHVRPFLGDRACVPTIWHEHLVGMLDYLRGLQARGLNGCLLISPSLDGELATMVAERCGARVIRGSSSRTGAKAFRALHAVLVEEGVSPLTTPDGPHGPRRTAKKGALKLAQRTGVPILPFACAARRSWRLGTWDRLLIPRPFTSLAVAVGEPIPVPAGLDDAEQETVRLRLEGALNELERVACARLDVEPPELPES